MAGAIAHRGPDGEGVFVDGPLGLAHRRLAVIDLTQAAAQPMTSDDGSLVLVYNGEIYDHSELRRGLERRGHVFRSRSDTEVLLRALTEWGPSVIERLNGMFAFAAWSRRERRLLLARDRYGVKPLYWYQRGSTFAFGSEVKAILEHPSVSRGVCYEALDEYFTFQNVLSDLTLFDGVRLLPPGCTLEVDLDPSRRPLERRYWDFPVPDESSRLPDDVDGHVRGLLVAAVERQLVSDVPVGCYLSGGLDSSSIAAVASRRLPRIATFTGGFDLSSASGLELSFDERPQAERLANAFKTEHYEVVMHAGDMEWVLPKLIHHLEDLRVGQSYPNYYVARLASKFVTVVLSGGGGDEIFGGYPWRYYRGEAAGREDFLERHYRSWQRLVPDEDKPRLWNDATRRAIGEHRAYDAFRAVYGGWRGGFSSVADRISASLYFELKTFLHGLLVVEDKLSMAHSLEARVPFLDNDLVDFALRLPVRLKLGDLAGPLVVQDENVPQKRRLSELQSKAGKVILRRAARGLVPDDVVERTKQGFSAPDASWFRGESITYINRMLRDPSARIYDYLSPAYVTEVLDTHCSGRKNLRLLIWSLLSFEWWCRSFLTRDAR